jgi:hypothetical protein
MFRSRSLYILPGGLHHRLGPLPKDRQGDVDTSRQMAAGWMFWLTRKRFFGSYFAFTCASRL